MHTILITIDWFYPAFKAGGPIVSIANFVENLSKNFRFYILTSNRDFDGSRLEVETDRWLEFSPNVYVYYASSTIKALQILRKQQANLLIINGIYSPVYSILPLLLTPSSIPKAIFPRGMLSIHSLKVKPVRKKIFLTAAKIFGLYRHVSFLTSSETEYQEILTRFKHNKCFLVPNFVSKTTFFRLIEKQAGQLKLVTVARISPVKNLSFAFEVLQNKFSGEIVWDIYGSSENQSYLLHLQNLSSTLPKNIQVNFKGPLAPYKVRSTIAQYHFFFLPTLGENFGHAIFDALASSRPLIISNNTPWKKYSQLGWQLPLSKRLFQQAIAQAIDMNFEQWQKLCSKAFAAANSYLNQQKLFAQKAEETLLNLINSKP